MILIDAIYVNSGGGKALLEYLIDTIIIKGQKSNFFFLIDYRLRSKHLENKNIKFTIIKPSENERKRFYLRYSKNFETFFCFGNVPPPIRVPIKFVYIYFQNILLIRNKNTGYNIGNRIKIFLKTTYIKAKDRANYSWIVQTSEVKRTLMKRLKVEPDRVFIIPFFQENLFKKCNFQLTENNKRFLYVADGSKQKNHKKLLEAWNIINTKKLVDLELHLTVPEQSGRLFNIINEFINKGCNIINHGCCSSDQIYKLYERCNYLIFPSLAESFGLPLIEAALAGCQVIASDLPFVHTIIKPLWAFDPHDANNIANVVLNIDDNSPAQRTEIKVENQISDLVNLLIRNYV